MRCRTPFVLAVEPALDHVGNADGLGGWNDVNRLSLMPVQATGMGFSAFMRPWRRWPTASDLLCNRDLVHASREEQGR